MDLHGHPTRHPCRLVQHRPWRAGRLAWGRELWSGALSDGRGGRASSRALWRVEDESTAFWMRTFYTSIVGGKPRAQAVRDAMATVKATSPHPHYWGALLPWSARRWRDAPVTRACTLWRHWYQALRRGRF